MNLPNLPHAAARVPLAAVVSSVALWGAGTTLQADLTNWWPLDETSGFDAPNAVAGGTDGALFNGVTWVNDGERGQVLETDGVDGYVDAGFLPDFDIDTDYTWSFWANSNQAPNNNVIVGNRYPDGGWTKFTTNAFEFRDITPTFNATIDYPDFAPQTGTWIHHAVVKRGALFTYFRDGVALGNVWNDFHFLAGPPVYFGGDTTNENWAGRLDDIATWSDALPTVSVSGLASGEFDPSSAPLTNPPVTLESVFADDFSGDLSAWTATDRGLENNAPAGYDAPQIVAGQLVLGGLTSSQYWFGSSVETNETFDSRLETIVTVDRISLAGFGTARRSSVWIFGDEGHYLHFSQNDGENGWQYNARDDNGAGTLNPTGSGNNLVGLDPRDLDLDEVAVELRVRPGGTAGRVNIEIWVDGILYATHGFTAFPNSFRVILTGQARAGGDDATAVFDNVEVLQEVVVDLPPAFESSTFTFDPATEGTPYAADLAPLASDPGGQALTFSKVSGPAWISVAPNGMVTGTPGVGDIDWVTFRARVEDPAGGNDAADVTLRVLPAMVETAFADDFGGDLSGWTATDRGLENNAPTTYDPPTIVDGELVLAGFTDQQYWFGNSVETNASFDARLETFVTVDRVSLDGLGTAWRSSLWIIGDDTHYLHFSQNVGENGWQFNANDVGGAGTLNPTGSGNNIPVLDSIDSDGGPYTMGLELHPTGTPGEVVIYMLHDGVLVAEHTLTAFPPTFHVVLTGQARAGGDEVTAVFDNFEVARQVLPNLPPAFGAASFALPPTTEGAPYSVDLSAYASDADGDPMTFSKRDGPDWVSVDPSGMVTGTPGASDVGLTRFTARVEDPSGDFDDAVVSIRVEATTPPAAPLAGWWPLNEGSGDISGDLGPGGLDGTIANVDTGGLGPIGEAWVDDPEYGTVLSFNGDDATGAFVTVGMPPDSGNLPVLGLDGSFSWSFHARQEQGTNNDIVVGNRYDALNVDFAPRQFIKFTANQFEWHWNGAGENIDYPDIPQGTWHHHAVVKEGVALYYYRDGILVDARTITGAPDQEMPIFFGGQGVENWRGYLSDIRFYSGSLTSDEVAFLAANPGGGAAGDFRITSIVRAPDGSVTITWNSRPNTTYAVDWTPDVTQTWTEADDGVPSAGMATSFTLPAGGFPDPATETILFLRVREL